jgi:hypothetical protein
MKMGEKRSNQSIEEIAASFLDEDKLKPFLDFYDFLKSNKLRKGKTGRTGISSWVIKYKNKKIGHFRFHGNLWSIDYFDLFSRNQWFEKCEKYLSAELKDFILTNINTTSSCCVKGKCHSVENRIILGKMFNSRVCACGPIMLINPDGKTLEYAKELVLMGKNIIAEMAESV